MRRLRAKIAITLGLVFAAAIAVELSALDLVRSREHQSNAVEAFSMPPWQRARSQSIERTDESEHYVPHDMGWVLSKIGITPVSSTARGLGAILVLLVLAGVEIHAAAQSSRESEQRFGKIFRSSPLAITISTQQEGRYLDVNDAFLQMLRYERKEIIGRSSLDLNIWVDPQDRALMLQPKDSGPGSVLHTRMRTSFGEIRQVNVSSDLIELDGIPCVLAITQDVTDTQRLEDQFRQAHKMEALGRLAAGVAHDFNNLLCVTMGYSELSLQYLDRSHAVARNLVEIKKAAERAASLTRRLLGFSRQQIVFRRILDLNAVVDNLNQMLQRMIGEDITLVFKPGHGLGRIYADLGQIEQVLMNLIVNARDAMPKGGSIILETSDVRLDDGYVGTHFAVPPGRYVMLSVSDSGIGMDECITSRIFEPFFTTKAPGQGSGLGLSTVYGIIKQSEGNIWVHSEPGRGTTFKIYFPRRDESVEPVPQTASEPDPEGGIETILVVEDDEFLRHMTVAVLESAGYKAFQAATAETAIKLVQNLQEHIHLLLTDVLLPDLNGIELAALLKKIQPSLRVLLVSGYTGELILQHKELDPAAILIEKPFTRRCLLGTIREVLRYENVSGQKRS